MIVTTNHVWNNLNLRIRASYYDSWVEIDFLDGPLEPVCTGSRDAPQEMKPADVAETTH